ncbi:hypothetical protein GCM10010156_74100 [Planobispora rosea]|uniref:Uncharacterized protein n=1 Tax=Planobispora rosea TaxID=35762 RepID=A0A8J3SAD5_PLARO|nr:hypothetical protein [Planobispora rosea]GGT05557.1 hypothetical protein GCM10010156_74100 [Planobispora rosea]GIH88941.1 hypothetical protein Pro02_73490 [Planobispora rosea]
MQRPHPAARALSSPTERAGLSGICALSHLADRTDPLFTEDAATLIHTASRGCPRAINNLVIQALQATFIADKTIVDESCARAAVNEVIAAE